MYVEYALFQTEGNPKAGPSIGQLRLKTIAIMHIVLGNALTVILCQHTQQSTCKENRP